MDEQDLSYALAKQVPDMHFRGFIIGTSYGEITVPPGPVAERLADHVRFVLALELARLRNEPDPRLSDDEVNQVFDSVFGGASRARAVGAAEAAQP